MAGTIFAALPVSGSDTADYLVRNIVGVDEADATNGRIAFVAPLARALLGKRPGDVVTFRTPRGEEELEVVSVTYGALDRDEPEA